MGYLWSILIIPCTKAFWLAQLAQEDANIALAEIILKPRLPPETNPYV